MDSTDGFVIDRRQALKLFAASVAAVGAAGCAKGGKTVTGIIGAMESEVSAIKDAMEKPEITTISGMEFCQGTISGKKVVVVQCGMGKVNAGICTQTLINTFGVGRVINTGVAGALNEELSVGDFVIAHDAVQHDYDVTPLGFRRGEIPYTKMVAFPTDEELRALAVAAVKDASPSSKVLEGRVCSGDQFITTEEQIVEITSHFGGLCAEMEGGAIAQVCYLNETPFIIIRVISDSGDNSEFEQFVADAAAKCASAVLEMLESL